MRKCYEKTETIVEQVSKPVKRFRDEVSKVCRSLPWPVNLLCKVVVKVIEFIDWVVETVTRVVTTLVCVVIDIVEVIADLGTSLIHALLSVPIIGPFIRWVVGGASWLVDQLGGLGEGILGLFGILPIKHLELKVVILRNSDGPLLAAAQADPVVRETERIFLARARVRVNTRVITLESTAPSSALHIDADAGLFGEDLTGAGSYFQKVITEYLPETNTERLVRRGAPIIAFVVEGVGTSQTGCCTGPFTDWVVIEPQQFSPHLDGDGNPLVAGTTTYPNTLAHEMAHACGLLHDGDDKTNLMYPSNPVGDPRRPRGDNLSPFQRMIVRSSTHVTLF